MWELAKFSKENDRVSVHDHGRGHLHHYVDVYVPIYEHDPIYKILYVNFTMEYYRRHSESSK
jgi:hypothetical protein